MPSPVEELVLTTHLSRVQQVRARVDALRSDELFRDYSAGQPSDVHRLAAMAPMRELLQRATELRGLSTITIRRVGTLLFSPPGVALGAAYAETWRALLRHTLELRKSIEVIRTRMDTGIPDVRDWNELAWQEDTIGGFVTQVMATLEEFPRALIPDDAHANLSQALEAHRQDVLARRAQRAPPGTPSRRRRRRKRLPTFEPLSRTRPAILKTVDEQHEDLELAAELFECDQCGGGMTSRIRERGANKLVCGYCGHERELDAPPRRPVLPALATEHSDIRVAIEGTYGFQCKECGAQVTVAASQMTHRCAYCGSHAFVQDELHDGLQVPDGMPRFACDADTAVKLLRDWLKSRADVDAGFEREFEVVATEPRYVPFWIFRVVVDEASYEDYPVCATRQLLHRLPAELRGIQPLESQSAPPFTRSQMAIIAAERFNIEPDEARQHAIGANRNNPIRLSSAAPRYMLLPLYFLVLSWQGQEYHALVDGARAGIGLRYPKSVTRLIRKRWWVGAAVAGLLVLLAGVVAVAAWGAVAGRAEREARQTHEAELDRQAALRAEQRRIEMEELKHIVLPLNQQDVTWVSEPFDLTLTTMRTQRFEIAVTYPVRVCFHLRLSTMQRRSVKQVNALRDPAASARTQEIVQKWAAGNTYIGEYSSVLIDPQSFDAMAKEIYGATMPEGTLPAEPAGHFELLEARGSNVYTGEFTLEVKPYWSERRKHLTVRITFEAHPRDVQLLVNALEADLIPLSMAQAMGRAGVLWTAEKPDEVAIEVAVAVLSEWKRVSWRAPHTTAAVKSAAVRR